MNIREYIEIVPEINEVKNTLSRIEKVYVLLKNGDIDTVVDSKEVFIKLLLEIKSSTDTFGNKVYGYEDIEEIRIKVDGCPIPLMREVLQPLEKKTRVKYIGCK